MKAEYLIIRPEAEKCSFEMLSHVTFEFKTPSGREYCATYHYNGSGSIRYPSSYHLDHINWWFNNRSELVPESTVNTELQPADLTLVDMLRHILTNPKYNVRREDH